MMSILNPYCRGYVTVPVIEACAKRGLFQLLDATEVCERKALIEKLGANAGYFAIGLELLESLGLIVREGKDSYRPKTKRGLLDLGLATLYSFEPEDLITNPSSVRTLNEKINTVFQQRTKGEAGTSDLGRGSIIVPLAVALQGISVASFSEDLIRLNLPLSRVIIELFIQQGWLTVGNANLTASGRRLLQCGMFKRAVS